MPHCKDCDRRVPYGQSTCSVCAEDPSHGADGYFAAGERKPKAAKKKAAKRRTSK